MSRGNSSRFIGQDRVRETLTKIGSGTFFLFFLLDLRLLKKSLGGVFPISSPCGGGGNNPAGIIIILFLTVRGAKITFN